MSNRNEKKKKKRGWEKLLHWRRNIPRLIYWKESVPLHSRIVLFFTDRSLRCIWYNHATVIFKVTACNYNDILTFDMWLNASLTSGVGRKMVWLLDWYANLQNTDICIFSGSTVPRVSRLPKCRGFTITLRHTTLSRTPLGEWSARCRDLCLTTQDNHKRQASVPPVGFEPAIQARERSQKYALDCAGLADTCINKLN